MRRLLSLLLVSFVVAGCASSGALDGSRLPNSPVVVSPYIQGLNAAELEAYLTWWRGANATAPSDGWQGAVISAGAESTGVATTTVHPPLDPACPLRYDYELMGSTLFENGDGLELREVNGKNGFYNPSRSEALFILRGTSVEALGRCDDKKNVGWLVARVSLIDAAERWIIDGLASPAATLTIAVDPGNQTIEVQSNRVELSDSSVSGYSPFRLRRFAITDTNRERVFEFAKLGRGSDQIGRRLLWFRASDLAGAYRATGCGPIAAFWGAGSDCAKALSLEPEGSQTTNIWLDEMARQNEVLKRNEDDTSCGVAGASCLQLNNTLWGEIGKTLKTLAQNAAGKTTDAPATSQQMGLFARLLGGAGGAKANYCDGAIKGVDPTSSGRLPGETLGSVSGGLRTFELAAVSGVQVEPEGRELIVRWTPLSAATGYELRFKTEVGQSWSTRTVGKQLSQKTIGPLLYGTSYFIQVRALPDGAWSAPVSATTGGSSSGDGSGGSIRPSGNCSYKLDWAIPATRLPDELIHHTEGGVAIPYADVFGVVAAGGTTAWDDTRDRMKESIALQSAIGYFASRSEIEGDSVTLSPSFRFIGGEDAEWYKRFSYLFGEAASYGPASMTFSTASSGQKTLRYDPSPASQIRITVTDTLNPNTKVTYKSEWIPTQAIGAFDDPASTIGDCGTFDFGCHIGRAISGFTMSIYQATFGQMVEGLSKGTVGNLLGVPILQQYEIEAVRDIAGGQQVIYKLNEERLRADPDSTKVGEPGEDPCRTLAQSGQLNRFDPSNPTRRLEPEAAQFCYQESGTWGLFNAARGIMVILLVVFIARFVLQLMTGRTREMKISAFIARAFLSLFLIIYVGDVLRFLGTIVAEVIVITNSIGSQVSGKPYSHLWMFSAYLNSPPAGANPFALILMAPFTILGLFVVAIIGWVRLVFAGLIVALSPIWIVNLLSARQPNFFYTSLMLLLRLYVIPIMALILMLAIFLLLGANDSFFGGSDDAISIPRAIIGALILIVVAVAPIWMAKFTIERIGRPITQSIQAALSAADDDRTENFLNRTGKDEYSKESPYGEGGSTAKTLTEGTLGSSTAGAGSDYAAGGTTGERLGAAPAGESASYDPALPAGDPMSGFAAGQSSPEQLVEAQRARELGVTPDALRLQDGAESEREQIEQRAALYEGRGYDPERALRQAERDVKGESITGGWARRSFEIGKGASSKVIGGMLGGSGVSGAARESLPGWAQGAVAAGEKYGGKALTLAGKKAGELGDRAKTTLDRHQRSVTKAEETKRDWAAAEGALNIAQQRLTEAKKSGDATRISAAEAELKRANATAQKAYRRVHSSQRTFAGRMSNIGVPVIGAGLRLRDGLTTDARESRKHLEKIDREIERLRALRMASEAGPRRNPKAVGKIDAKLTELERRRSEQATRVAAYRARAEIAGRRRQTEQERDLNRARQAAARVRNIEAVRRGAAGASVGVRETLDLKRAEARRAAAVAASRAGQHGDSIAQRVAGAAIGSSAGVTHRIERLGAKIARKLDGESDRPARPSETD